MNLYAHETKAENEMLKMTTFICLRNIHIRHLNYNTLLKILIESQKLKVLTKTKIKRES